MNDPELNHSLLKVQADGLATRILLDELRAGRVGNVLELLEQQLDVSVLQMHKWMQPSNRHQVLTSLRILRDYRSRRPRKIEAVIEDDRDRALALKTRDRVAKILNEIPNAS